MCRHRSYPTRRRALRSRPRCEGLETRRVLSGLWTGDLAHIMGLDPAPDTSSIAPPTAIVVHFDAQISPDSLGFGDVSLNLVGDDGSDPTPVFDPFNPPNEALDDTGTELLIDVPVGLAPGRYQVVLSGFAGLYDDMGNPLTPADGEDRVLGEFTVQTETSGPTLFDGNAPGASDPGSGSDPLAHITGLDPASGPSPVASPTAIVVHFDAQISPDSLGFGDVSLNLVGDDGSDPTPVFDPLNPPNEVLDDTGTALMIDVPGGLAPGHYQVVLSGFAGLYDIGGNPLTPADGEDRVLGEFTVRVSEPTFSGAIDLGALESGEVVAASSLPLDSDPFAAQLYRFTLPAGHHWRVGAEVQAQRIGSPLNSQLTLLDSTGKVLRTADLGRSDALADPSLFAGLDAGEYFLAVTGSGDIAGAPGAYDPATGDPGSTAGNSPGGAFELHVRVDQADVAPAVVDFRVEHADPLEARPTGFSLQFSAPLDLGESGRDIEDAASAGIRVVDASGRSWPVAAIGYDQASARLRYLFLDRLPVGKYSIVLDGDHPLTDLAGLSPTSAGLRRGVLATFAVLPQVLPTGANNLGGFVPNELLSGVVSEHLVLAPGQTVNIRYVGTYDDFYTLRVNHSDGPLGLSVIDVASGKIITLDPGPAGQDNDLLAHVTEGLKFWRLTNPGDRPIEVTLKLTIGQFGWDQVLANGLGQGPALNLMLLRPDLPDPSATIASSGPSLPSPSSPAPAAPGTLGAPFPAPAGLAAILTTFLPGGVESTPSPTGGEPLGAGSSVLAAETTVLGPSGLVLGVATQPVGLPGSSGGDHIAAVGPAIGAATVAMAAGTGRGQGTGASLPLGMFSSGGESSEPFDAGATPEAPGALAEAGGGAITPTDAVTPEGESGLAFKVDLPSWMSILRRALGRDESAPAEAGDTPSVANVGRRPGELLRRRRLPEESGQVEQAGVGLPLQLGLLAALTHQARRVWKRRTRSGGRRLTLKQD